MDKTRYSPHSFFIANPLPVVDCKEPIKNNKKNVMNKPSYTNSQPAAKALMAASLALVAGIFNSHAADGDMVVVDGITYTVTSENDKTAQLIWDNDASGDDLTIPSHITSPDNGNTYAVTSLYEQAFSYCEHKSVTLPETLLEIGNEAFRGSFMLSGITVPNSVKTIGEMAFADCAELTSATLSDAMTAIPARLFGNCAKLTSVTIGSSTTEVDDGAFSGCGKLAEIYCKATTPPQINVAGAFPAQDFENGTLYVPVGCKTGYENDDEWNKFGIIKEYDFTTAGVGHNMAMTQAGTISATTANGAIIVDGTNGGTIEVFSINGQCLYRSTGNVICGLGHGVYVIKVGNQTAKVIL